MSDLPLVVSDFCRWYALSALAIGERTGLLEALLKGGGTPAELAAAAGVDPRNAELWAGTMVVAGYARVEAGRTVPDEDVLGPLRGGFPFDLRAAIALISALGSLLPRIEQAVRDGAGISSEEIQAAVGPLPGRINAAMYELSLLDDWIAGHPELEAALRAGIEVAEIGSGGGAALRILAGAFPTSHFTGCDLDPVQVDRANAAAVDAGLSNLDFRRLDAAELPAGAFDLVLAFDTFHHFVDSTAILRSIHNSLRVGGSFLVAEPCLTGDPSLDAADPTALLNYGGDLLYCFQESKVSANDGLGAVRSSTEVPRLLAASGFAVTATHRSPLDYSVIRAQPA